MHTLAGWAVWGVCFGFGFWVGVQCWVGGLEFGCWALCGGKCWRFGSWESWWTLAGWSCLEVGCVEICGCWEVTDVGFDSGHFATSW